MIVVSKGSCFELFMCFALIHQCLCLLIRQAIRDQFRRFANVYFLVVGAIMFVGQYSDLFDTAISPWTTLGPLAVVIMVSLFVEGSSDYKRHQNDHETNNAGCVILRRSDELEADGERDETICRGKDVLVDMEKMYTIRGSVVPSPQNMEINVDGGGHIVRVAFQKLRRKDIRQGHFVLVKNREMVPADCVLLASSNDQGGAYIETSSIDGETNLKLRNSPHLPSAVVRALRDGTSMERIRENADESEKNQDDDDDDNEHQSPEKKLMESIEDATKRITRFSYLGFPDAASVLTNPALRRTDATAVATAAPILQPRPSLSEDSSSVRSEENWGTRNGSTGMSKMRKKMREKRAEKRREEEAAAATPGKYVAALTTEPPNASVHTFSGKLTLPPLGPDGSCHEIPLGAENVLLRGAVIRNTEWVIGLAFFTGKDTKLVQNSFETPSKFSQLDQLINKAVVAILLVMVLCISYLATEAVNVNKSAFDTLFYAGFNKNTTETWPYFRGTPAENGVPGWDEHSTNWIQYFLLYVTLLNNFIPLSLYVSVEMVQFFMLWLVYSDLEMYDDTTDTRAVARSTIVSDLGRIEYIFSDKTGTLTQNVMRFKRCSVDGMVFGAPIARMRPGEAVQADGVDDAVSSFHPLRQLLVGRFLRPSETAGLEGMGVSSSDDLDDRFSETDKKLTFNVEMFLRVLSLCHTVVVEKDIDHKEEIGNDMSVTSGKAPKLSIVKSMFAGRGRANTGDSVTAPLGSLQEGSEFDSTSNSAPALRSRANTATSVATTGSAMAKNSDGAPHGYAYQAESPDEGALVSAASSTFSFQVVARDSSGIKLRCSFPSHLQNKTLTSDLSSKKISLERIAGETAAALTDTEDQGGSMDTTIGAAVQQGDIREETWKILAVNKFDSDRKRMSILLRSPKELGNLPILFCKGADSSMMDPAICRTLGMLESDARHLAAVSEDEEEYVGDGDTMARILKMQVHLGEFAKEGLRTLVLGMRLLTEQECKDWMEVYNSAAVSLKDRENLLSEAALMIEKDLHIVGATAIEDKLQKDVPETISTLGKAGIKLWVLTGDKRETAVEIGYSTHVLNSKMHLTEVPDMGKLYVRTQLSMEFIRLTKIGRLRDYQMSALSESTSEKSTKEKLRNWNACFQFNCGKCWRGIVRLYLRLAATLFQFACMAKKANYKRQQAAESEAAEKTMMLSVERRRGVRTRAEQTIKLWLASDEGLKYRVESSAGGSERGDHMLASEEEPKVFVRAQSAQEVLQDMANSGELSQPELRELSIAHLTAHQASVNEDRNNRPIVDEDTLSLESFVPGGTGDKATFDKKKRTLLERMFAVDRTVRKGLLIKHITKEKLAALKGGRVLSDRNISEDIANNRNVARALVIEGAALKHLLGDPHFEEILFAVASNCDAVIACRVSPRQKALLVGLVRQNVLPEPVTLAIGDGANDVGMIQEAHVGVGISGKEGKQAVNASDFSIAQFRFLETLILIHGRWNFFRLSTVTLFSFYKNALMAGTIIVYTAKTLYSGTPLYDEWVIAMLNFVAAWPIIFTGFFDRTLSKEYVRQNPEVYSATRENQLVTVRSLFRWIIMCFGHVFLIYYFTVPQQSFGGGITPAFLGLMKDNDRDAPGDGEGGDLKSVGTVTFSCMIVLLAFKVRAFTANVITLCTKLVY